MVLRSRFERRPFSFLVTCAVTFNARVAAMTSFVSQALSAPTGDAPLALFLFLLKHQQRGLALGVSVGLGHHGGGDQAVAVLH